MENSQVEKEHVHRNDASSTTHCKYHKQLGRPSLGTCTKHTHQKKSCPSNCELRIKHPAWKHLYEEEKSQCPQCVAQKKRFDEENARQQMRSEMETKCKEMQQLRRSLEDLPVD